MSTREIARGGLLAAAATAWLYFGGVMPQIGPALPWFLSISTSIRLLETKAISMPEKKADMTIVTNMPVKRGISVSKILCYD